MTLQEFIEKTRTDEALKEKVNAAIMEKVILPMAQAEGVELSDEELDMVNGGCFRGTCQYCYEKMLYLNGWA